MSRSDSRPGIKPNRLRKRGLSVQGGSLRQHPRERNLGESTTSPPYARGRRTKHYGKDIETVHREEATFLESSIFIGAFLVRIA